VKSVCGRQKSGTIVTLGYETGGSLGMRRGRSIRRVVATATLGLAAAGLPVVVPGLAPTALAAPTSVVVAAAGDIACDPADSNFSGNNPSTCQMRATANLIAGIKPSYLLPIGDTQYVKTTSQGVEPTLTQYQKGYGATWGQLPSRVPGLLVRSVAGNHEYGDLAENGKQPLTAAANYYRYFGPSGLGALPPSVTGPSSAWYSYDIPVASTSWHVVALDGECYVLPPGSATSGCGFGSAEESWLAADLAANQGKCTLAYIHEPRWAWGDDDDPRYAALWSDLVRYRATAVLGGHDHFYERFAPMDANGNPSAYGVAEFVVGTGGHSLEQMDTSAPKRPALRAYDAAHFGVLKMTLQASSLGFAFQSTAGNTIDSGTLACNAAPPASAPVVSSVTPIAGSSAGGTTLAVSGSGFSAGATVTVAGVPATNVTVTSPTALTAVAPAGTTTGDVSVTTANGTSAPTVGDQFTHTLATNGYAITLSSSASRPAVGGAVTLTATANQDLGPTPYFYSIVDTTTGQVLATNGSGRVLTVTVTQNDPTTKRYVAQIDIHGHAPLQAVATPQVVTWANPSPGAPVVSGVSPFSGPGAGVTVVTVTGSGFGAGSAVAFGGVASPSVAVSSPTTLTATAPAMLASSGPTVDVTVTNSNGTSPIGAADLYSYSFATNGYAASIAATTSTPAVGGSATLTATANQDIGPTPYGLSIVDVATGSIIAHTGWGNTVSATVTQTQAATKRYLAQVDKSGGTQVQAASAPLVVTWSGAPTASAPAVTSVSPTYGPSGGGSTVTVAGSGFAPDAWVSFGGVAAGGVTVTSPTSLSAIVPAGSSTVHAVVATGNGNSATGVNDEYTYTLSANGYSVTLAATTTSPSIGGSVTLTATANQDLGPTPYTFSIIDATTGAIVAHSGSGTVISTTISASQAMTRRFVAQVDNMGGPPVQAMSAPKIVTWS
jgi:hypothetical protein